MPCKGSKFIKNHNTVAVGGHPNPAKLGQTDNGTNRDSYRGGAHLKIQMQQILDLVKLSSSCGLR